jgi:hypothetical protein
MGKRLEPDSFRARKHSEKISVAAEIMFLIPGTVVIWNETPG